MWIIRGIIGLACLGIAVATVPMWFTSPVAVVFTMVFASLGLWVMGYVSKFSPKSVRDLDTLREIEIRKSRFFGLRNRAMGLVAIFLGGGVLVLTYQANWDVELESFVGSIVFLVIGIWYLVKGARAETLPDSPLSTHAGEVVQNNAPGEESKK